MGAYTIEVTQLQGSNHRRIGLIDGYLSFEIILRFNDVGSWTLKMQNGSPQASLLTPGTGIVVWVDGLSRPFFSGPLRAIQRDWSDDDQGRGTLTFSGVDHNVLLAEHICMPDPAVGLSTPDPTTGYGGYRQADAYYGNGQPYSMERLLNELPYTNFGPGAWSSRRLNGCYFADPATWPASTAYPRTTFKLRFEPILEAFQSRVESCVMADGTTRSLGYRWVWNPAYEQIAAEIYHPYDNAANGLGARFSPEIGNIRSYSYQLSAPQANWFLYGLDTENTNLLQTQNLWIADSTSADPEWQQRSEAFVEHTDVSLYQKDSTGKVVLGGDNKPVVQTALLATAATQDYTERGPTGSLSVEPITTVGSQFGRDYWLGDRVTVSIDGTDVTNILREIHITDDDQDGPTIAPVVGDPNASATPALYRTLRRITDRVHTLERKQVRNTQ